MKPVFVWLLIAAALLAACAPQQAAPETDVAAIVDEYTAWTRLYDQPRNVSLGLWMLCRLVTAEEMALVESEHGNDLWLNVYVNPTGAAAMRQIADRVFPAGSVIVKEKLLAADSAQAHAYGFMVKREAGFNPAGGDWEYIYQDENGVVARGVETMSHCQSCHISDDKSSDSVFGIIQ